LLPAVDFRSEFRTNDRAGLQAVGAALVTAADSVAAAAAAAASAVQQAAIDAAAKAKALAAAAAVQIKAAAVATYDKAVEVATAINSAIDNNPCLSSIKQGVISGANAAKDAAVAAVDAT
jgi:hypothetical protein